MNIWLVTIGEPLPLDLRIRKHRTGMLADVLVSRGHKVRWWVSAFEHQRKTMVFESDQEVRLSNGLTLQVLYGRGYRRNISFSRYLDHEIIARKFAAQAGKLERPDAVIASMPSHSLAYEVACYCDQNLIPCLIDIRDLWPDIFLTPLRKSWLKKIGRVLLARDFSLLHRMLKKANGLIAVSDGYLQWGLKKINRPASIWDRVFYLGYRPNLREKNAQKVHAEPKWLRGEMARKLFVFIGTFGVSYELELILDVARKLDRFALKHIGFVLAGTGEKADALRKAAADLPNVTFTGWIQKKEIETLLNHAWAGLVPCRSAADTLPNKPFEYLSVGLPLISSLEGEMAGLIKQYGLGLNYKPGDVDGLYRAVTELASNGSVRNEMSSNALKFFELYGDADKIYSEYADHIEELVRVNHGLRLNDKGY